MAENGIDPDIIPSQKYDVDRCVIWCTIGGSAHNPATRDVSGVLVTDGWHAYVDQVIWPMIELGYTRFALHNPFGTRTDLGEAMQADQYLDAISQGTKFLLRDFKEAFRPVTERCEVISYLGSLRYTDSLNVLRNNPLKVDNWLKRIYQCYYLSLEAGMSIGFDGLFELPETDAGYRFCRLLESLGVKVYVEPWPHKDFPNFFDLNSITTYHLYTVKQPWWAAPREQLTGEVMIILNRPPTGETWSTALTKPWLPDWCRYFYSNNMTPAFGPFEILRNKMTFQQLMEMPSGGVTINI